MAFEKNKHRVDIQVAIMSGCIITLCSALVFFITYTVSYKDMIKSLQDRVSAIYYDVDEQLGTKNFTDINDKEDVSLPAYQEIQSLLLKAKETAGVMYLYTAKTLDDGTFIYVVDGLSTDSEDFRYPGDLIEPEIQAEMSEALTSEIVMPDKIKDTSWGHIFIAYLPIINEGEVIGVLGVEFDAGHQYETYKFLLWSMTLLIVFFCFIVYLIAFKLFRRISNPNYKDFANTDMLSGLKNRNAFNTDINNLNEKDKSSIAISSIDLDNLKTINDSKGHLSGDEYIIDCVESLKRAVTSRSIIYRIGGDEFAIITHSISTDTASELDKRIGFELDETNKTRDGAVSLTLGYAIYDDSIENDLMDTFKRADERMYKLKKQKRRIEIVNVQK